MFNGVLVGEKHQPPVKLLQCVTFIVIFFQIGRNSSFLWAMFVIVDWTFASQFLLDSTISVVCKVA